MNILLCLALFFTCFCHADFTDHLQKVRKEETTNQSIKNIDFIYLINLDLRPEKLKKCAGQLAAYNISFHRFPAIFGWNLTADVLDEIGVTFSPEMLHDRLFAHFAPHQEENQQFYFLDDAAAPKLYGKTVFSHRIRLGAIGCTLSHLSILQDAYDAGYQTIWIMEDDICITRDPAELTLLIEKLDQLVGADGWDILYTDLDKANLPFYSEINDFESDLKGDLSSYWRPDIDLSSWGPHLAKREILSEDFIKIGSRYRTHSMVIRRSGMKKILDFAKTQHIFMPYDDELAVVPGIQMVSLRYDLVTFFTSLLSDTSLELFLPKSFWEKHKILADNQNFR